MRNLLNIGFRTQHWVRIEPLSYFLSLNVRRPIGEGEPTGVSNTCRGVKR
jgi:hypothetical protein